MEITGPTDAVPLGGSVQYVAVAKDNAGNPIPGVLFDWVVDSQGGVAKVDGTGKVSGVDLGDIQVRAFAPRVIGQRQLRVFGLKIVGGRFALNGSSNAGLAFNAKIVPQSGQPPDGPIPMRFSGPNGWTGNGNASVARSQFGQTAWVVLPGAPVVSGPFTASVTLDGQTLTAPPVSIDTTRALSSFRANVFRVSTGRLDLVWTLPVSGLGDWAALYDLTTGAMLAETLAGEGHASFTGLTLDPSHDYGVTVDLFEDTQLNEHLPFWFNVSRQTATVPKSGWLDDVFGQNGILDGSQLYGTQPQDGPVRGVIRLDDGKLLVLADRYGQIMVSGPSALVMRLNNDGSLDPAFGNTGRVMIPRGYFDENGSRFTVQPDGKIVVVSVSSLGSDKRRISIRRLNVDGSTDTNFGIGGDATLDVSNFGSVEVVGVRSNGSILIGGTTSNKASLFQVKPDGSLDTDFDGDGLLQLGFSSAQYSGSVSRKLLPLPNGQVILIGTVYDNDYNQNDVAMAKINSNGTLDTSFGNNGLVRAVLVPNQTGGYKDLRDAVLTSGGRIAVLVRDSFQSRQQAVFARFTTNGALDGTFGTGGVLRVFRSNDWFCGPEYTSLASDSDGRLAAVGPTSPLCLVRINANGTVDSTFGTEGTLGMESWPNYHRSTAFLLVTTENKLLVVGQKGVETVGQPLMLMRLLP